MAELSLEQKALRVIECIVMDDFCEDWECRVALHKEIIPPDEAVKMLDKLLKVFEIAHSVIPEHICYSVHDNWRKETEETYQTLKEGELVP